MSRADRRRRDYFDLGRYRSSLERRAVAPDECGNVGHPDGCYHPYVECPPWSPSPWRLFARWRYSRREDMWGCGCTRIGERT